MVAGYLAAERDLGRVAADADISTLAPTLIGAAHLLFTDADGTPEPAAVARVVAAVLAAARSADSPSCQTPRLLSNTCSIRGSPTGSLSRASPPLMVR